MILSFLLFIPTLVLALALFTNRQRRTRSLRYELTPNCLLTRWPVLFITGPRSIFYFSQYWNIYPEFLTEHGYEVYTLNLPWSDSVERATRLRDFLREHSTQNRHYHLVVDTPTREEFATLWQENFSCISSLNEITSEMCLHSSMGLFQALSYRLHHLQTWPKVTADPHTLGVSSEASLKNAQFLLQKISQRAEEDLQSP